MTQRERAHDLIDALPEDSVRAVVQVMLRMYPFYGKTAHPGEASPKMKAYGRLEALRRQSAKYDFSEEERARALEEKYGPSAWTEDAHEGTH